MTLTSKFRTAFWLKSGFTTSTGGTMLPGLPGHTILGINLTDERYLELRNDIYENYDEITYILFTKYKERAIH
jgi:hypothetical protein